MGGNGASSAPEAGEHPSLRRGKLLRATNATLLTRLSHPNGQVSAIAQASVDARYQGPAVRRIIAERFEIPSMVAPRPRSKICDGEQHEYKAARRPGRDRPAQPFEDFPEVVRAGDEPKPAAPAVSHSRSRRARRRCMRVLSAWRLSAKPAKEIPTPIRKRGSASHSVAYAPNSEMKRALMYALIALKKKPDATSSRGVLPAACPDAKRVDERPGSDSGPAT